MTKKRTTTASPPSHEAFPNPSEPYRIAFAVAGLTKSPNALLGSHWRTRSGHAKKWMEHVRLAINLNGKFPPVPLKRAEIWCLRLSSGKAMDEDNLGSSFKVILDALKKLQVIEDDSKKHVIVHYDQDKAPPGKGSIQIRVEERI
jgi:Holliday junction resolvase RusA-like endonuclease